MRKIAFVFVLFATLLPGCRSDKHTDHTKGSDGVFAFDNVNVVPMDTERILENQTVIVRDGKIAELGDAAKLPIPQNATRVDGRGKYLMPGLADMHTHVQSEGELLLLVAHGVTAIRDMFGSPYKIVWRDRIARGEMFGPTIYTAGPIVDGPRPDMSEMARVTTAEDSERIVVEQKQRGYDFIKVYHNLSREGYDSVLAAAKKHGIPTAGHVAYSVSLQHAFDSGQNCIEHLTGYVEDIQRKDSPYIGEIDAQKTSGKDKFLKSVNFAEESKIPDLAARTRQAGVWNCPTLIAYRDWGLTAAEIKERVDQSEMKYVHPMLMAQWSPVNKDEVPYSDAIAANDEVTLMKRRVEVHKKITKALNDVGAGLLLGTDTGVPFVVPGVSAIEELELLVSAGLTPYQALKTGTSNPAEYLKASDRFGTVTVGKRADLILVEDNPLKDVAILRRRSGVMLRGQWLPENELRRRIDELMAGYTAPKDWFKGMPGLPSGGQREFTARYTITSLGLPKGEERLIVEMLPGGRRMVVSQLAVQEPEEKFTLRMESDDTFSKLSLESYGREGNGNIEWLLKDGRLLVNGSLPVVGVFNREETAASNLFLGAPGIAVSIWLYPEIKALGVGRTLELPEKEWDFGPAFDLSDRTWKVKRLPDVRQAGAGPLRAFAIDVIADTPYKSRLTVDEHGWPASMEVQRGEGLIKYQRVQN